MIVQKGLKSNESLRNDVFAAFANVFAGFFVRKLGDQDAYERTYAKWVEDPDFPEIWNEQVANLDMSWVNHLTKLQSIPEGYIENNLETKISLQKALLPLAEKYQPKPNAPAAHKNVAGPIPESVAALA